MGSTLVTPSFVGGEITPTLYGRVDLDLYGRSLRTLRNFLPRQAGGVDNRAGTRFVAEVKDSTKKVWLTRFKFSNAQTYILEWGDHYLRFHSNGGTIVDPGNPSIPYEIATPYAAGDVPLVSRSQSADVVFCAHRSYAPQELKRLANDNWTIGPISFLPSIPSPTGLSLTSGVVGDGADTGTSDANKGLKKWSVCVSAVADNGEESLPCTPITDFYKIDSQYYPNRPHYGWSAPTGLPAGRTIDHYVVYRGEDSGVFGFIARTKNLYWVDSNVLPDYSLAPVSGRDPFSGADKYPGAVLFSTEQRVIWGSSNAEPQKVWASRIGAYRSMAAADPPRDDDALEFNIGSKEFDELRQVVQLGVLLGFTGSGEYRLGDVPLTPGTIGAPKLSTYGAANLEPLEMGAEALFVQERGSTVRAAQWDINANAFVAQDLTLFAQHLFDNRSIVSWAAAEKPYRIVLAVMNDGSLLTLTYLREHAIAAWARHDTDGAFECVQSVIEGNQDAVYFVVRRTVNGQTRRYIERLAARDLRDPVTAFFVDCGLTYDGRNTGATTLTLEPGSSWDTDSVHQLVSSANLFSPADLGAQFRLTSTNGAPDVNCRLQSYVNPTTVSVQVDAPVPADLQNTPTAAWGRAVKLVAGFDHLEGRALVALADGQVHRGLTVTGGTITLDYHAVVVSAGLGYVSDLETLDLNVVGTSIITQRKLVPAVLLTVDQTRGLAAGETFDDLFDLPARDVDDEYHALGLFSGKREVAIGASWNLGGRICVRQSDPVPASILSLAPKGVNVGN